MTFWVFWDSYSNLLIYTWSQSDLFYKLFKLWPVVWRGPVRRVFENSHVEGRNEVVENLLNSLVGIHELSYEYLVSLVYKLDIVCIYEDFPLRCVYSDELWLTVDLSVSL